MKKQVVVIHGGDTFETYEKYLDFLCNYEIDSLDYFKHKGWKSILQEKLGDDFEVIRPQMPNKINAKYLEWRIWFEKLVPLLNPEVILIGHSLGGIFLAKYLSENNFPKKIRGVFLVGAGSEGDFVAPKSFKQLEKQGGKIFLYHSKDDRIVPFSE